MHPGPLSYLSRPVSWRCALRIGVLAWLLPVLPVWAQPPPPDPPALSRYQRTLQYLLYAPEQEQVDFAGDALARLVEVYMAEADLARSEAREQSGVAAARLRSWAVAVDQYANQLLLVLDDLEQGFPLELSVSPKGPASLTVAGRPVMLLHPRPSQQGAYEREVLDDYCGRHDCLAITATAAEEESAGPIPMSAAQVNPRWSFTNAGPVCSYQDLEVHFGNTRQLAALRDLCAQLMQELIGLAVELAWQRRHGVAVNWAALDIVATPGRPGHVVHLNLAGDSILANVPLLAGSEGLLADIVPWLRARSAGEDTETLQLDAAAYGWMPPAQ